ncbi:uncharacterized protein LOC128883041 isoform X2 [Hylaeus volcanicus]|uniref:uncharacterized protein LOC128883041 isoform X2 n=1 Tax=Hylaeus volcanicus TaxID=313075 RepID=UPI0023B7BED9|nr:uncharacterized protein LOC128883041 isoform X2 [Hylaeus volcanicus]
MKNATSGTWFKSFSNDLVNEDIVQENKLPLIFSQEETLSQKPFPTTQTHVKQDSFQGNSKLIDSTNTTDLLPSSAMLGQPEITKEPKVSSEPPIAEERYPLGTGEKKLLPRKTRKANVFSSINVNELKKSVPFKEDTEKLLESKEDEKIALPVKNEDSPIEKNESNSKEWERKRDAAASKIQAWWKGTLTRIFLTGALVERRLRYNHQGKDFKIKTNTDPYRHFLLLNDTYSTHKLSLKTDSIKPWPRSHVALLCDFLETLKATKKTLKPSCTIQGIYTNKLKESYNLQASRHVEETIKQLQISEFQRREIEKLWELNDDPNADEFK